MIDQVRAELVKLRTTKLWLGLLLGGVVLVTFYVLVIALTAGTTTSGNTVPGLDDPATVRTVYGVPFEIGFVMPLTLGVIAITGEYRYRTITATLLACPRRSRVVAAKACAVALVGLVMGVVLTLVSTVAGAIAIAARGYPTSLTAHGVPRLLGLMVLGLSIWALFGLGLGALLRNQVAAIVGGLVSVTLVEGLVSLLLRWLGAGRVASFLPSNASNAIVQPSGASHDLLSWWAGSLVLLAWAGAAAAIGAVTTMRHDVT